MRITKYRTELDKERKNILVKEKAVNYVVEYNTLNMPIYVVDMLNSVFNLKNMAEEYLYAVAVDTKNHCLGVFEITHGTVDSSLISPREIFIRVLLCGAASFFLVHNHPSGETAPSKQDIDVAKRIKECSDLMGIRFQDNIIVGANDNYYSFYEHNEL